MLPTMTRAPVAPAIADALQLDLVTEANHRIANNLALIAALARMQAANVAQNPGSFTGEDVRLVIEEFGGRIESVARLHRLLANPVQQPMVDLADYLRSICEAVVANLAFAGTAELRFEGEPGCSLSPKRTLSLGLIVGELVTNAVKYAHPTGVGGIISVGCRRGANGIIAIEVADDGVSLPTGLDPMQGSHLGLRLVRSLADQRGAELSFADDGLGLTVLLEISPASIW